MSGATFLTDMLSDSAAIVGGDQEEAIRQQQFADNLTAIRQQEADSRARGGNAAGLIRMQATQLAAKQRVAYANSGVDISQGTPAATMDATRLMGELDAQTALNNAAREAWGYERQGAQLQQAQRLDAAAASNRKTGQLLSTAGTFMSDYGDAVKLGMGGGGLG
jgi:hypothetical protein